jgi:hypothetical protein
MHRPQRPFLVLALGSLALLPLGVLLSAPRGEAAPLAAARPGDTALNHWIFDIGEVERAAALEHARQFVEHHKEAHPGVHFETYRTSGLEGKFELHVLLETVNTTAQRVFLDRDIDDEPCRSLIRFEDDNFEVRSDSYMRLIASDPEKEERMGPQGGIIVWSLRSRFPLTGDAVDCAAKVTRHLNQTYPGVYFRAYDEWFPRSGRIHFYIYGSSISAWESTEYQIRQDPVFRARMAEAADAFVPDSFEDEWIVNVAR